MTDKVWAPEIEPASVREGLYDAYVERCGIPTMYKGLAIISSNPEQVTGREAFDMITFAVSGDEAVRYKRHGIASVNIWFPPNTPRLLIDTYLLDIKGGLPHRAWIRNRSAGDWGELSVLVASAKQHASSGAIKIDSQRRLEGLLLDFDLLQVSPNDEIPYDVDLVPLYAPQKL